MRTPPLSRAYLSLISSVVERSHEHRAFPITYPPRSSQAFSTSSLTLPYVIPNACDGSHEHRKYSYNLISLFTIFLIITIFLDINIIPSFQGETQGGGRCPLIGLPLYPSTFHPRLLLRRSAGSVDCLSAIHLW